MLGNSIFSLIRFAAVTFGVCPGKGAFVTNAILLSLNAYVFYCASLMTPHNKPSGGVRVITGCELEQQHLLAGEESVLYDKCGGTNLIAHIGLNPVPNDSRFTR